MTWRSEFTKQLLRKLHPAPCYEWNSPQDTRYAHSDERFSTVVHVFHRQWIGIRAAAGSLPGNKLAIDAHRRLTARDIEVILGHLQRAGTTRFVFHGVSDNADALIRRLSVLGLSSQTYLVYHGNVTQWYDAPERKLAFQALQLAQEGHVRRLHVMRPAHHFIEQRSHTPMLLNIGPLVGMKTGSNQRDAQVFVPGTHEWRKNLHCNAMAGAMVAGVETVVHYAPHLMLPEPWKEKLKYTAFVDREGTYEIMSKSLATLNVSLSECHPMVALESEAHGTPCLRARLFLDAFDDHPYVRIVEVEDATSPFSIGTTLERVLTIPRLEMSEMLFDYSRRMKGLSVERYLDFLAL